MSKMSASEKSTVYHSEEDPPFQDLLKRVAEGGVKVLLEEYKEIKKYKPKGASTKIFEQNPLKNRYQDVGCWDHSRVKMTSLKPDKDYIHANFVDGFIKPRQFIATQGPIEDVPGMFLCTIPDFWTMIWDHNCNVIIMLCQVVEMGKAKCAQYWPDSPGEKQTWGDITVETKDVGERNIEDHKIHMSTLEVTRTGESKVRSVVHFLHSNWPDRKCPPSAYPIVEFLIRVHTAQKTVCSKNNITPDKSPMVVHCSAGIGRSGTFLAIDIALNLVNKYGKVSIKEVVRLIRTQRHFAVQTPVQYVCVNQAIIDYLVKHKKVEFDSEKFKKEINSMR